MYVECLALTNAKICLHAVTTIDCDLNKQFFKIILKGCRYANKMFCIHKYLEF